MTKKELEERILYLEETVDKLTRLTETLTGIVEELSDKLYDTQREIERERKLDDYARGM